MKPSNHSALSSSGKGLLKKKSIRLLLKSVGGVIILFIILFSCLLGRLALGPIYLDFLTPDVEAALKDPKAELSATVGSTQLVWRKWYRPCEIELVNVHLHKAEKQSWLKIKEVGLSLRLYRLLTGEISLKKLRIYGPHLTLEKDATGNFSLGFGASEESPEFSLQELASLLMLKDPSSSLGKLNDLAKFSILGANIVLKDEDAGQTWDLPKVSFVLRREWEGFRADVTLSPQKGRGDLTLGLAYKLGASRVDLYGDFRKTSFPALIDKERVALAPLQSEDFGIDDILNFLHHWDSSLSGKVHLAFRPKTFELITGSCDLDFGKGELDLSLAKALPFPVTSGNVSLKISPRDIQIKNLALNSQAMEVTFEGKLVSSLTPLTLTQWFTAGQNLDFEGEIKNLQFDHLNALWPQDLAVNARKWITQNVRQGILRNASFSLKAQGGEQGFELNTLEGKLEGEGMELTYLKGLPPAQKVKARSTFDQKSFDVDVLSGDIEGIDLEEGHVVISGLDKGQEAISIDLKAKALLSDVLRVIDHQPLKYPSKAGIVPKKTKGQGQLDLHMSFPLLAELSFKDIKMKLKGVFQNVEASRKLTDSLTADLKKGALSINLSEDQMLIEGTGVLNGLSSTLSYAHFFTDSGSYESELNVETIATFEDFKRLGFDYVAYGKGPAQAHLKYLVKRNEKSQLWVDLDLTRATLTFAPLGWIKNPGQKSSLGFALGFHEGQLAKIKQIKMTSPTYALEGNIEFGSHGLWRSIYLSAFKGPNTDTQVMLERPQTTSYEVSFKGQSMDVEKYLTYLNQLTSQDDVPPTSVKVAADLESLRLGEGRVFKGVKANANLYLNGQENTWKSVKLRAKAGQGTAYRGDMASVSGGILFDIVEGPNNTQTLLVRANDAGQFLKNLDIYHDIKGGYITIKAERQGKDPYKGTFKIVNFNANKVPLLARFAALLSPLGIVNLFSSDQTLSMEDFRCKFEFSEDLIKVRKGVGKSISLGFTVEGQLDRKKRLYTLSGNIIPARFINSVLNNIPLIGSLINGGKGEGLFGMAYTVKGPFSEPVVSLNPLSALAPGFIRNIFQSIGGDEE